MRELELENEEQPLSSSEDDGDLLTNEEIDQEFVPCRLVSEAPIALNKRYILQVAATNESHPTVASVLSNNTCEIHMLSADNFAKLSVLEEHSDVITDVKIVNKDLVYTGSCDGTVRLWDLRQTGASVAVFKDSTNTNFKQFTCFDISPNNLLLSAGTNLYGGDAYVLFWDVRKQNLLGGYWESHTDDITQVKFHPTDSNKLISGSVDGLINLYDLSESSEDDALIDSLNTESSIEKLNWVENAGKGLISCITHTADVQFWRLEDAQPFYHLRRLDIAKGIRRKSEDYIYVVDVHQTNTGSLIFVGSNYNEGECFRGLAFSKNNTSPRIGFSQNKQRVRSSFLNANINLLITGGEKGILNAWNINTV